MCRRLMRRGWIVCVVASTLSVASNGVVGAQPVGGPVKLQHASGFITAINAERGALALQVMAPSGQPAPSTAPPAAFLIDENTEISKGLRVVTLDALRVGDRVTIQYLPHAEGARLARALAVMVVDAAQ